MKKIILLLLITFISCSENKEFSTMDTTTEILKINETDIKILTSKIIFFGHQSVGNNVLDGFARILPATSGINIKETKNPKDCAQPVFAHSLIGENRKPQTKIKNFESIMHDSLGKYIDIAIFKFCYIDITSNMDINSLFEEYRKTFDSLQAQYPDVKFVHFTVPLTTEEQSISGILKFWIKRILSNKTGHVYDNIQRMRFNEKLLATYGNRVFDISRIESTKHDGTLTESSRGGVKHYSLLPEYTYDGGHLNIKGSTYVAYNLVLFLSDLK